MQFFNALDLLFLLPMTFSLNVECLNIFSINSLFSKETTLVKYPGRDCNAIVINTLKPRGTGYEIKFLTTYIAPVLLMLDVCGFDYPSPHFLKGSIAYCTNFYPNGVFFLLWRYGH